MVEFDRKAFIGKFQEESGEYLQRLNEGVIRLETEPGDAGLIDQMLRDAHTLKGSSRMVGLIEISDLAHHLEDIMVMIRDGQMAYEPSMSDLFFEALDVILFLSENAADESAPKVELDDLLARLSVLAQGDHGDEEEPVAPKPAKAKKPKKAKPAEVSAEAPAEEAPAADATPAAEERHAAEAEKRPSEALRPRTQATIRVRTSQVDALLNLISEVVISRIKTDGRVGDLRSLANASADVWQRWMRIRTAFGAFAIEGDAAGDALMDEVHAMDDILSELRRDVTHFGKSYSEDASRAAAVINDLQEQGMRLRMLPVSTVFSTFPRAVRDLAKEFNKDVDLVVEGESTELDKKVLEEINDPLIHIMRNAIDHGIEAPDVRKQAGKPAKGTIRLAARQEGDHIVIEVADDGAGIDPQRVREAAVRKGYLTEAEAGVMSDREATFLIFEQGFSTSSIITEISGRGVGMDVVRQFIVEKLKGSLHVESQIGVGTTFQLTIPLTLAIIRALVLRVGGQVFAIPTASIEETIRISPSEIQKVEGREIVRRQRRNIPLVRLGDIIGVVHENGGEGKLPMVVVGSSGHRLGFIADSFKGEQQIVIKSLGSHLRKIRHVAGVTVLGAGEVVPILNVPDLMSSARERSGVKLRTTAQPRESDVRRSILICEDSFTTRELERSIFEAAGYDVEVAADGKAGLDKLRAGLAVDAVVTDVQMPNMTGFELTRAIKTDEALMHIPVIIVTSLEREEEKAEGIDAGADAYITKSVFNQDMLLDTVERLIH